MKKFSSRLVQSLLPLGIIVLLVSSTVKPMEVQKEEESIAYQTLKQLSLDCNFKDFQVKVSTEKNLDNEVNQLAEEGHIVALWTKLYGWYGKLNGKSLAEDVNQFLTDLVRFEVILGVNCVQFYNFTNNDAVPTALYLTIKNHIQAYFDTTIKEVAASATSEFSYQGVLAQTEQWIKKLSESEVTLPSCGWIDQAKVYWHSQWSCAFFTIATNNSSKIVRHGSLEARALAKNYFNDFSHAIFETLKLKKNWRPDFVNSKNDIIESLNLAALTVGKSIETLNIIEELKQQVFAKDQQIKNWEQQVSERNEQIKIDTCKLSELEPLRLESIERTSRRKAKHARVMEEVSSFNMESLKKAIEKLEETAPLLSQVPENYDLPLEEEANKEKANNEAPNKEEANKTTETTDENKTITHPLSENQTN